MRFWTYCPALILIWWNARSRKKMIIKNVKVFQKEGFFEPGEIYIRDGKIMPEEEQFAKEEILDGKGAYAIPGLTDIHFHGCMGHDFSDGTPEAIRALAEYELSQGITQICPATMTLPEETLLKISRTAAAYDNLSGARLVGINMEGPFVSEKKKGAQNGMYIHKPDAAMFKKLQKEAKGLYKLIALAPEEEGALEFIEELKEEAVISLAHTTADYDTAMEALKRGANHVTHLFNAMPAFSHRETGVVGAAFDTQNCDVELIVDGIHISPSMVRAAFKMFGDDRVILISDSMMATGLTDGDYSLGGQPVKVKGNLATLEDGTIAGSATNLMDCLRIAVKQMEIPLESAVKCAAVNSARSIGIDDRYGSLEPGKVANIVLLDENLDLQDIVYEGKVL